MKIKKILAIMLLFLTIFGFIQPVLAKSGSSRYVGAQYASKYITTESYNNRRWNFNKKINRHKYKRKLDCVLC